MHDFRVLYIEHETSRHLVVATLSNVAKVDLITSPDALEEYLQKHQYDLVITDAFFLKEDVDHSDSAEVPNCRLGEVVKTVRQADANRVKIAVLTRLSPALLDDFGSELTGVDYLWDKHPFSLVYLVWHVNQIKQLRTQHYPTFRLVNEIQSLIASDTSLPWRDELSEMFKVYWTRTSRKDKLDSLRPFLSKIALDCGDVRAFGIYYDLLIASEPLTIASNTTAWAHLKHTINVFWLGYYIINCGAIDSNEIARAIDPNFESESCASSAVAFVNQAWFLVAFFHDIGLLGEKVNQLTQAFNTISAPYKLDTMRINSDFQFSTDTKLQEQLKLLSHYISPGMASYHQSVVASSSRDNSIDHGLLAAIVLLTIKKSLKCQTDSFFSSVAEACALHCTIPKNVHSSVKIQFSKNPLLALLVICDQLEVWDRDTDSETMFSKTKLEFGELTSLAYDPKTRTVSGLINYKPMSYITPDETAMFESQHQLTSILLERIIPVLSLVDFDLKTSFSMNFNFKLNGRIPLASWHS